MPAQFSGINVFVNIAGTDYLPADLNIIKMIVTDTDEGDSTIELVCEDNKYIIADSSTIKVGALMSIKWGYTQGRQSQQRTDYVLMKPSVSYSKEGVTVTLKAYTKSATLAARQSQKVYGPTTVSQIVNDIASRNGLTLNLTGGQEAINGWSMANWTDRQTLRVLADRFGYQVTFSSDTITFAPIDYGAAPQIALVYNQGERGNIISAELSVDARHAMGDSATVAAAVNPITKTVQQATAQEAQKTVAISAEDGHTWLPQVNATMGSMTPQAFSTLIQPPVFEVPKNSLTPPPDVTMHITTPDFSNLSAVATGEKLKKQKTKGELTIVSNGFVTATARLIVNVIGLAHRDSGNWYVQEVIHEIDHAEGYVNHWSLSRHGNNTHGGEKNKPPLNNQLPPSTTIGPTIPYVAINPETGKPV